MTKQVLTAAQKKKKEEDLKVVKGRFRYEECPGGKLDFCFGGIYDDVPIKKYTMYDNQIYDVPLMVANHLNDNCRYEVHAHCTDSEGKPSTKVGRIVPRISFNPLVFTPNAEFGNKSSDIITVQKA